MIFALKPDIFAPVSHRNSINLLSIWTCTMGDWWEEENSFTNCGTRLALSSVFVSTSSSPSSRQNPGLCTAVCGGGAVSQGPRSVGSGLPWAFGQSLWEWPGWLNTKEPFWGQKREVWPGCWYSRWKSLSFLFHGLFPGLVLYHHSAGDLLLFLLAALWLHMVVDVGIRKPAGPSVVWCLSLSSPFLLCLRVVFRQDVCVPRPHLALCTPIPHSSCSVHFPFSK